MRKLKDASGNSSAKPALLLECKRIVRALVPDAEVLLYGSRARGTADAASDHDILVLSEAPLSTADEDRVRDALYDLELEHGVVISLLFYAREEWDDPLHRLMPLHQQVELEGILL